MIPPAPAPPVRAKVSGGAYAAPRRSFVAWWGATSLTFAVLAASFLPTALLGGGNWAGTIEAVTPLWAICCLVGVVCGIRGIEKQRRIDVGRRWLIAFAGLIVSLLAFVALTIIAIFGNG